MADMEKAKKAFNQICRYFDNQGWKYDPDQEKLWIATGFAGEDIPMSLSIRILPEFQLIKFLSTMPFAAGEDKHLEGCIAACATTYKLADGSFIYDVESGRVTFMLTAYYSDDGVSDEAIDYMLRISLQTIDKYNDKLEALLINNTMSLPEYIAFVED